MGVARCFRREGGSLWFAQRNACSQSHLQGDAAVPDKDSVPKMVSDMSLAVQKIGNKLQEMSGADAIAALDALRTKYG